MHKGEMARLRLLHAGCCPRTGQSLPAALCAPCFGAPWSPSVPWSGPPCCARSYSQFKPNKGMGQHTLQLSFSALSLARHYFFAPRVMLVQASPSAARLAGCRVSPNIHSPAAAMAELQQSHNNP